MQQRLLILAVQLSLAPIGLNAAQSAPAPTPLLRAHAHNDYEHPRPLLDALDHGFSSVEADIYLVEGKLLVAHDLIKTRPARTLQALYLDPLRARVTQNSGRVYPGGPTMTLLVDIKSEAEPTYAVLREILGQYSDILTRFTADATEPKAVTVVLSGNRPRQTLAKEPVRFSSLDGRLPDLDGTESKNFIPLISDNWTGVFKWRGVGPFPEDEKQKLRQIVQKAHDQGRRIRFWGAPDRADLWQALHAAGVDLINTDDLPGLQKFLSVHARPKVAR